VRFLRAGVFDAPKRRQPFPTPNWFGHSEKLGSAHLAVVDDPNTCV